MSEPLLIIAGPTGVGKSAAAIEAARRWHASILSADSMQVYRGMEIGTAQPSPEERGEIPHYLVGHVLPGEEYHVARFVREADEILGEHKQSGRRSIVCGGTGLFLKHLVQGIFEGAPRDEEVRRRLQRDLDAHGYEAMRKRLRAVDPVREAEINPNDAVRVLRALEVYELTGTPMSSHHARHAASRTPRPNLYVVLSLPRPALMQRIEARVDKMIAAGWVDEARRLLESGIAEDSQAAKALGYRELFRYLRREWPLEQAAEEIKRQTRRFAKRQLTWFRAVPGAVWIDVEGLAPSEVADRILRQYPGGA